MIFGTYTKDVGAVTSLEVETSQTMQDYLLAFLKNPDTLSSSVGWPKFDVNGTDGGTIIEFGKDVAAKNITGNKVDGSCWNTSATFPYYG